MDDRRIKIGSSRWIGGSAPTIVIAEIGQNHNGDPKLAHHLVDAAAWAGAHAVKFVKRDIECELSKEARGREYLSPHAFAKTYGEHRRALELAPEIYASLVDRSREHGLLCVATACDPPSVDVMHSLEIDAFKIASRDLENIPLLRYVAAKGKPILASTGMSRWDEIDEAVDIFRRASVPFGLLQCTSLYPTPMHQAHLRSIAPLAERYQVPVGFSDHTQGGLLSPVAVALGACIIEKHLTLDRRSRGSDHACSLEPEEFRKLVEDIRQVETALGSPDKPLADGVTAVQAKLGRSLVAKISLAKGTRLEESMLVLKSPGEGISWRDRDRLLGKRLTRDVSADEIVTLEDCR